MGRNIEFNKEEKVKKAMDVFWEKGFNGASVQDLVDAMQINRSSLYNTIGGKEDLFLACLAVYSEDMVADYEKKAKVGESPLKAIKNIVEIAVTAIVTGENSCFGIKSCFELASIDEKVKKIIKSNNDKTLALLAHLINKAIQVGELQTNENSEVLADYIISSFAGWRQSFILHGNPIKVKKMSQFLLKSIENQ